MDAENTANDKAAIVDGLQERIADLTENLTNSKNEIYKLRKTNDLQQERLSSAETKNLELETELASEKNKAAIALERAALETEKAVLDKQTKGSEEVKQLTEETFRLRSNLQNL